MQIHRDIERIVYFLIDVNSNVIFRLTHRTYLSYDVAVCQWLKSCNKNTCIMNTHVFTVGKQTPCKLSFTYITVTSQGILTFRTKPKFAKNVAPFAQLIFEMVNISYHMQHICLVV